MIDLGRAFKAPFEDREWFSKTLLGFVWGLLVVTSPAVYGAQLEYIRGVSRGDDDLPSWDDFGKKWADGLLVAIAGMLYFLPVIIIAIAVLIPWMITAIATGDSSNALSGLLAGSACLFIILAIIYSIAVSLFFNAAITHYAIRGNFGAFFEFGEILAKVRGGTGYFTAWFYSLIIGFAASAVASVLAGTMIGGILYPAIAYLAAMMTGHVLGQWASAAYGTAPVQAPGTMPGAPRPPAFAPPMPPAPAAPVAPAAPAAPPAPPEPAAPPAPPEPAAPPAPPEPALAAEEDPAATPIAPPAAEPDSEIDADESV
jgi:hypothetical protein